MGGAVSAAPASPSRDERRSEAPIWLRNILTRDFLEGLPASWPVAERGRAAGDRDPNFSASESSSTRGIVPPTTGAKFCGSAFCTRGSAEAPAGMGPGIDGKVLRCRACDFDIWAAKARPPPWYACCEEYPADMFLTSILNCDITLTASASSRSVALVEPSCTFRDCRLSSSPSSKPRAPL